MKQRDNYDEYKRWYLAEGLGDRMIRGYCCVFFSWPEADRLLRVLAASIQAGLLAERGQNKIAGIEEAAESTRKLPRDCWVMS